MREPILAPYLYWAKSRRPADIDLAGSNLVPCGIDDLPGARDALDIVAANDNGYAPLVDAIARHYAVDAARVVTGTGCSGANFLTIAALVSAGDHVIIERPAYDPLIGACALVGARITRIDRRFDAGFAVDPDELRAALTPHTRLVVLTSPHNPSGVRLNREALAAIGAAASRVGARVLVDEVYLDAAATVAGEAATANSVARLDGPFIVTNSLTKSYGLAGLKCGWVIADAPTAERIRRTRDVVENAGSAPADRLGALAFAHLPHLAARTRAILSDNITAARAFFARHPELALVEAPQASVVFPHVKDAIAFTSTLLEAHGVAVAPGAFFDAPDHVRISLAGTHANLTRGLAAIERALAARR